jgi:excisionase family DNA binding protein
VSPLLTPKQVARAIGVSESSLKRWCDKGLLETVRTAGGHRRIAVNSVLTFLRDTSRQPVRPDLLGLPSNVGQGEFVIDRAAELIFSAITTGDDERCRRIVFDLYLAGHKAFDICDRVITPVFAKIGDCWECGKLQVFEEHRASEIALRLLYELRTALPRVPEDAPTAIGGTVEGDPYRAATTMVEIALREQGWRADSLGPMLPTATLCDAIEKVRPRLFWLSASSLQSPTEFVDQYESLYQTAFRSGTAVVVGGRALTEEIRQQIQYSAFCDNLRHVVAFAATLGNAAVRSA